MLGARGAARAYRTGFLVLAAGPGSAMWASARWSLVLLTLAASAGSLSSTVPPGGPTVVPLDPGTLLLGTACRSAGSSRGCAATAFATHDQRAGGGRRLGDAVKRESVGSHGPTPGCSPTVSQNPAR
ncbi:putative secreted protein [Saccharothrix espanaensis DSM 44229]|uniref:Putative secreted protein n=1 Tax=Saccharothrix espanaensis (strain ATCC 51144 / DSM 44229 / JCM 9112 / NBRC 15066 / NRRL 15764) TaxID=1179773 RepID=K0JYF4_SACES|nr:putative secreted protein [Saccharothrix espanaensis DSM 44229]